MTRGARRVARATGEAAAARPAPQGGDEVPAPSPRIAAGVTSGRRALPTHRLLARARDLAHVEYGVVDAAVSLAHLHRRRLLPRPLAAYVCRVGATRGRAHTGRGQHDGIGAGGEGHGETQRASDEDTLRSGHDASFHRDSPGDL